MEYYQFLFDEPVEETKDILIALLNDIGFTGFEEEEAQLKAFIKITDYNATEFENVIDIISVKYSKSIIKKINWNEKWEASFEPVTILHPVSALKFVHIRAGFHEPDIEATYDIEITPKMSFGTGHHATTTLVIEQMCRISFENKDVIDFGTGTGILAILAEKLGASSVIAIDNDDWSINNARENISTNHCSKISLVQADSISPGNCAQIILANINLNIIVENVDIIYRSAVSEADFIFSGIMTKDEPVILKALAEHLIKVHQCFYKNDWMVICAKK